MAVAAGEAQQMLLVVRVDLAVEVLVLLARLLQQTELLELSILAAVAAVLVEGLPEIPA